MDIEQVRKRAWTFVTVGVALIVIGTVTLAGQAGSPDPSGVFLTAGWLAAGTGVMATQAGLVGVVLTARY